MASERGGLRPRSGRRSRRVAAVSSLCRQMSSHDGRRPVRRRRRRQSRSTTTVDQRQPESRRVLTFSPDAAVVRTSLMYGLDEMDRGTAELRRTHQPAESHRSSSPTSCAIRSESTRLPRHIVRLAETAYSGTLNVAGRQALSREAFGRSDAGALGGGYRRPHPIE